MIQVKQLHKNYLVDKEPVAVLKGISFSVEKGEFLSIMGRSGCGKTTLLNVMGLMDNFDEGEYLFDGQEIAHLSERAAALFRRQNIGFIFQNYHLLQELSCLGNVGLTLGYAGVGKKQREMRATELLETVGLSHMLKRYPNQLSGGQQQRVAIARALAMNPRLILADEPTGNLDYQNGLEIMHLLKKLNSKGTTIVMVTHDTEFSKFADRVLIMKDGMFSE